MSRPIVWSIGGSDTGAGAGIQADLRALDSMGVHGCTAVAAITAQNSVAVHRVDAVTVDLLESQLAALAEDLPPAAIKTGLLGSPDNVLCVANWVDRMRLVRPVALVVDPVWRASTGFELGDERMREALLEHLLPRANLVTPNCKEAAWLLGLTQGEVHSPDDIQRAAQGLIRLGARSVVVTGGDAGDARSMDWLHATQTSGWLALPRFRTDHHHGTGCTFASTAAAALALGFCTADAAIIAKMNTTDSLFDAFGAGKGAGAVRPRRGFGRRSEHLPTLELPKLEALPPCPPLRQSSMGLYAVVDSADWVRRVIDAGVRTVQLRIKQPSNINVSDEIRRSVALASATQTQLFINDHWRLAIEHGAYGVHLGQDDLRGADMKAIIHAGLRVGISTHAYWEVCTAMSVRPSYIACGPVYATTTKDMPWLPQGNDNLRYWSSLLSVPVVAIGGMTPARSHDAALAGCAGVAVHSGIVNALDPALAIREFTGEIIAGAIADRPVVRELPWSTTIGDT